MAKKRVEIIVIGAGLIGLCSALILGKLKFNVILIDKNIIESTKHLETDTRTIAISYGTKILLEKYNIWRKISKEAQPINIIKVLNRTISSKILFDTDHINNPMGFIVKNSVFKKVLINEINKIKNIKKLQGNKIIEIKHNENEVCVLTDKKLLLKAKLLIGADGKNSFIKSKFKIPHYNLNYNQSSLALNFEHEKNHNNTAYEIFLKNGPLATLPMKGHKKNKFKSSLIWTDKSKIINDLKKINSKKLQQIIEKKINPYLGNITKIDNFKVFPLTAHICRKFYSKRIVLIGDAAHSIHPIAGQGWNLGMRDVKYLTNILLEYRNLGLDLGSQELLKFYNDTRYTDVFTMLFITHNLNKIFSSKSKIINKITSLGFNYINNKRYITKKLVKYAMGINL